MKNMNDTRVCKECWGGRIAMMIVNELAYNAIEAFGQNTSYIDIDSEAKCYVLGIFQQTTDWEHYPVVICELDDGRVFYADPEDITFIDRGDF